MTIGGMPAESFFAFLSWPVIFVVAAIIVYFKMAKGDASVDDSEFEQNLKTRKPKSGTRGANEASGNNISGGKEAQK